LYLAVPFYKFLYAEVCEPGGEKGWRLAMRNQMGKGVGSIQTPSARDIIIKGHRLLPMPLFLPETMVLISLLVSYLFEAYGAIPEDVTFKEK
jgi:hypothetical protein